MSPSRMPANSAAPRRVTGPMWIQLPTSRTDMPKSDGCIGAVFWDEVRAGLSATRGGGSVDECGVSVRGVSVRGAGSGRCTTELTWPCGWIGGGERLDMKFAKGMAVAMVNGKGDKAANSWVDRDTDALKGRRYKVRLFECEGGHVVAPPEVLLEAMQWIKGEQESR